METIIKTDPNRYCNDLSSYSRRETIEVAIGDVPVGGKNPIRVQSMTTVDTMDTQGSIDQCIRMIDAGCEYVRITAPSLKEAKNLANIKKGLWERGYQTPLVADIHFTPNAAELAAKIVEKVRINPGNYADKKKFELITYDHASYQAELDRIRERFVPLVKICKEYGTAMRIGTNHGSLSDRIMSRYGDTPLGMVESALEFIRICEDENFFNLVVSMKSSNPQVMVQAYRLLVNKLSEEKLKPYPLHLGVTEAGDGEDGRIKSALGIGTLLEDGLGDTVRVSLTEEPEAEVPVGFKLVERYNNRKAEQQPIPPIEVLHKDPFAYLKVPTTEVFNIGGDNVPRVIADFSQLPQVTVKDLKQIGQHYLPELDKWSMSDHGADFIYTGKNKLGFMLPNGLKEIIDYPVWLEQTADTHLFPMLTPKELIAAKQLNSQLNFVSLTLKEWQNENVQQQILAKTEHLVLVLHTKNAHAMAEMRYLLLELHQRKLQIPVVIRRDYNFTDLEQIQLHAATDIGGLLIEGLADGAMLSPGKDWLEERVKLLNHLKSLNSIAFGILQASRRRMTKTEYISCPSCGRTLFDLQETTAMIRKRTDHLKGVKIGIMGCIVNGPGEMADADYGYVGSGKGKITLYRGQEVVKRGVPSAKAVDELIEIIREDGNWLEPQTNPY